jgi:hypothetical protein
MNSKPQPAPEADECEVARARYSDARARLHEIEAEISRIEILRWSAAPDDDGLAIAAEAFLNGESRPLASTERRLEELRAEREVVRRATDLAGKRFHAARDARNRTVAGELRPAHKAAAQRVAECLVALAEANCEESRIRARAPGLTLPNLSYPNVDLGRQDTAARHFLRYVERTYKVKPSAMKAAE